ncbi:hypothetical protein GGI17_005794 [Coemansia sp. S146]|nr:hypothetical protein GGI17_005794 [Coemansia sp. S146]
MESPSSPFQSLPMLIVRKIIEYLEKRAGTSFDLNIDAYNQGKSVLTTLLSVSERCCAAALVSICDNCLLSFDYSCKAIEVSFPAWPASVPYSQYRKTHPVKRVVVSATLWKEMCDGTFCDIVTRSQYENMSFPSAKTLVLNISKTTRAVKPIFGTVNSSTYFTPVAATDVEKVTNFARSLLQLSPAITDAIVSTRSIDDKEPNSSQLYNTLVSELCRGSVKSLQVHSGLEASIMSIDICVSGLASIKQGLFMASAPFAELAYLNMGTLESLEIKIVAEANWRALIYGSTETLAVYSNLKRLALTVNDVPYTETWVAIEALAPFPVLSALDVCGGYPFDDDLLFRGNGDTLKSLRLPFGAIAKNALIRFNVLQRCDSIRMNSIHSLVLTNLVFDLGHIIRVITALPSLASLTCEVRGLRSNIGEIPTDERPESLRSAHYPQ